MRRIAMMKLLKKINTLLISLLTAVSLRKMGVLSLTGVEEER
jgi:hypothetical protein